MLSIEQPKLKTAPASKTTLTTPYYLIDEAKLLENLKKISYLREESGAKFVLALKCFSTWSVFDILRPYLDGTTSSSLFEARLGHDKFGKEVHAYSVAYSESDIESLRLFSTKVIFNSVSQLRRFFPSVRKIPIGLRINPGVSSSDFDLANPARRHSRLGVSDIESVREALPYLSGAMFHFNCENNDFEKLSQHLDLISDKYGDILKKLEWVSLGGGIYFTKEGYPLEKLAKKLLEFSERFDVQLYLEPGESVITQAGSLVTTVLDIVHNDMDIAIVDSAVETHMPDLMIYQTPAKVEGTVSSGGKTYQVTGRTCLAGDVFGTYQFPNELRVGDNITFLDAAGYTMVKKSWFNGIQMPSIAIKKSDGRIIVSRRYDYSDYLSYLS
jgi:carboxynorspermidine decarboxylase